MRVGGVPELITDGHDGLLFAIGDVDAMANSAIALLRDTERHAAMRCAARKTAQDRFCSTRIIPRYVDFYRSLIG